MHWHSPRYYFTVRRGDPPHKLFFPAAGVAWIGIGVCDLLTSDSITIPLLTYVFGCLVLAATWGMMPRQIRNGYRNGWFDGRRELLASLPEAHQRGLSAEEWVRSQMERELAEMADWAVHP